MQDKLNRTKVIEILIHHAKSKQMLQFVFLTPQDVSFINNDVSILRYPTKKLSFNHLPLSIFRLEDPERVNN